MFKNNKHIKLFLTTFALVLFTINTNAQEVHVVDNKGTIITVNNNLVTTSLTQPLTPVEGDIWFDTTNNIIKTYDVIDGWKDITATSLQNIYTIDGTLTGSRTITGGSNSITFTNLNNFVVNTLGSSVFTANASTTITSAASNVFTSTAATQLRSTGGIVEIFGASGINLISNSNITGNLSVTGTYSDSSGDVGTAGQILSSTATTTNWIDNQKNTVNTSSTEITPADYILANPTYTPIENDTYIYTPTSGEKVYYVYDGAAWNMIAPTKAARVFYPPSIAIDASTAGNYTLDLYNDVYRAQFDAPLIRSDLGGTDEAPISIPTYQNSNELYYYVTEADLDVFGDGTTLTNMSITAAGVLSYTIVTPPTDDNTVINVVFVVK